MPFACICSRRPHDIPPVTGHSLYSTEPGKCKAEETSPSQALVFKIMTDPHVGKLTYIRVLHKRAEDRHRHHGAGTRPTSKKERIGRLMQMHADKREEIETEYAGDICAVHRLKDARTGDTLCDMKKPVAARAHALPRARDLGCHRAQDQGRRQEKLGEALMKALPNEDPTFQVRTDEETGQTIISGMGELHLEIIVDRMKREFGVEASVGKPQVAYRETFKKSLESEGMRSCRCCAAPRSRTRACRRCWTR